MAERHDRQNTIGGYAPQSSVATRELAAAPATGLRAVSGLVVFALGANAWVTHVLFTLLATDATPLQYVVGALALVCLTLGVAARAAHGFRGRELSARWLLLCVYPALLGLTLALGGTQLHALSHGYVAMPLCAAALLAYGIAATLACRERLALLTAEAHPLVSRREAPAAPPALRGGVIALTLVGAFLIATVAPLWPAHATLIATWGDAADAGAALSALVATATAVSVVAIHLGTALRRSEPRPESAHAKLRRVATLLFLALLGFATYFTVT